MIDGLAIVEVAYVALLAAYAVSALMAGRTLGRRLARRLVGRR